MDLFTLAIGLYIANRDDIKEWVEKVKAEENRPKTEWEKKVAHAFS
ncbi:MAG: hypothetical protein FWF51_06570 [Chitinivibrionia bacterium]|nr:hypothetical protein [Chitinivibrionia bacterium]